jgi:hypothetical protein
VSIAMTTRSFASSSNSGRDSIAALTVWWNITTGVRRADFGICGVAIVKCSWPKRSST